MCVAAGSSSTGILSLRRAASSLFDVDEVTTRSGRYRATASALGRCADRFVRGARAGWLDWSSTATTCRPAPIANSVSVALGESETTRRGLCLITTLPLAAVTVTGNRAAAGATGIEHARAAAVAAAPARV